MWKLYNPNNQGIAIQTSFANLSKWCSTIPNSFIGLVTYFDYKRDQPTTNDFLGPFMRKRKSFAHEAEVRIIQSDFDEEMKSNRAKTLEDLLTIEQRLSSKPSGKLFSFPLDPNIEGVYVNRYAPNWYFDVIRELVKTVKPALANRLQKSDLANPPYF
jgi:hypothetical protein